MERRGTKDANLKLKTRKSQNEHRIAVAEEAVALANRLGIRGQNQITSACLIGSSEGADEHQQGRAREMKICKERVRDFEVVRRIDENLRLAGAGEHCAPPPGPLPMPWGGGRGRGGKALKYPHGSGADGDDRPPGPLGLVNFARAFLAQLVTLRLHRVGGDGFSLHRRKRSQSDMQRDEADLHACRTDFVQQRFGEVQTRGGRSDGAWRLGENSLVALTVLLPLVVICTPDVRRQRNLAQELQ